VVVVTLPRKLNLGCGQDRRDGFLNVDAIASVKPDLVWNLDRFPYPLPSDQFDEILALDVVEHLENPVHFIEECWRVLRPGGEIQLTTPHFSSANSFRDPTHRWHFGYYSFEYFTDQHSLAHYSNARFATVDRRLVFPPTRLNRIVASLARRNYRRYEDRWCWIFPAWFLEFRLRAVKSGGGPAASPGA
jgi:SAM-dependent methyltransferase